MQVFLTPSQLNNIKHFQQVTKCTDFEECIRFLNSADWFVDQAIALQALCTLTSIPVHPINQDQIQSKIQQETHTQISQPTTDTEQKETRRRLLLRTKRKCQDLSIDTTSTTTPSTSPAPSTPNGATTKNTLTLEQARKLTTNKTPNSDSDADSDLEMLKKSRTKPRCSRSLEEILNGQPLSIRPLQIFLSQKPTPRWDVRLDALKRFRPDLIRGYPELLEKSKQLENDEQNSQQNSQFHQCQNPTQCQAQCQNSFPDPSACHVDSQKKLTLKIKVLKDIFQYFPQVKQNKKYRRNLQRGLIKHFDNLGFRYSPIMHGNKLVFVREI
ncbi:hypothetical protein M0811_14390 [Anaeramoeba ignava]|uniref:Uncharacterized protein n=1 Tax=Anaeramoeba ignava TaxID=1746090 RepID=A0A9Q0LVE6_ANAIG|nr:hypothetical protein M0811_14390 [Anaeramoeba ignava]|eukprot:Anaeramoba_ignava/a1979_357.p1 GENE.a1979_357~~a1979_357.p1  ORF type:complete len:327 (+),score=108.57 a1979_357:38-1018(+)